MKLRRILQTMCCIAVTTLLGCSTNPSVQQGASIQEFARSLSGQKFSFELTGSVWVPAMSGVLVTAQQIPKGLLVAIEPATQHCTREGGEIAMTKLQAVEQPSRYRPQLPLRVLCERRGETRWALDFKYSGVSVVPGEGAGGRMNLLFLNMTTGVEYLSAEHLAERMHDEHQKAQAEAQAAVAQRGREMATEQERQQLARSKEIEAARVAAQWPARVAAFRANLKAGDRFKWTSPPNGTWGGPIIGMVVRVEAAMAFVQFDNLTIGGQQSRYIVKEQLEPFDGPTPVGKYEIK